MTKTRRSFTDEFKREAVKLVKQPGTRLTPIARDLGIEPAALRRWVSQEPEGVLDYIERFYNPVRKHSELGFLSPAQFEHGLMGMALPSAAKPVTQTGTGMHFHRDR